MPLLRTSYLKKKNTVSRDPSTKCQHFSLIFFQRGTCLTEEQFCQAGFSLFCASGEPEGGKWWKAVWLPVDENHQEEPSQGCGRHWTLNSIRGTDWQFYILLAFPTIWSSFLSWIRSELDCQMMASGFGSHLFSCFVNVPPGHFQSVTYVSKLWSKCSPDRQVTRGPAAGPGPDT